MPPWYTGPLDGRLIPKRTTALRTEGAGYVMPGPRDPAHEPVNWFQTDYDDAFYDPDVEPLDVLPTPRHRSVP